MNEGIFRMRTTAETLSLLLAELGSSGDFATRFTVEADPQLHVEGVGDVPLPVTIHSAHRLCAVARPAHHGYKDQTRLDPRVRDTWEIPASAIRFDSWQWPSVLGRALARIARELGLPSDVQLDAELHNLLVYAPGQFFAVHQDSEKTDGMLGTLVVTLPSRFTGGDFVVSHQGRTLRARGSASRLSMVAFYADCHHEVRPVKQGYRVVLTWNLIARGGAKPAEVSAQTLAALADAVNAFWQPPQPGRGDDDESEPPDRLVYLLDHEYTQSGLSWTRLKGADAVRVAALRKVAERLDAEIFLALADVHEIWSAEDDPGEYGHWDYADDEEEMADDDDVAAEPVLGELIDSDIELRHWLALDGSELDSEASFVARHELCFTRPSSDCTPFESEYQGYMGNYGNTLDRWYHRAAVVMWSRENAFVIRARQSPHWAIEQIADRLEAGDAAQALVWARRLQPFWKRAAHRADAALLDATLPVAALIEDADIADMLLAPFSLRELTRQMAPCLLRLMKRHGLAWCAGRLRQWAAPYQDPDCQLAWLAHTLPGLTAAFGAAANMNGPALAAALVEERWNWLQKHIGQVLAHSTGSARMRALEKTGPALLALIRGSRDGCRPDLRQPIIDTLLSADLPVAVPLGVLRAAAAGLADVPGLGLGPVHARCLQLLAASLALPERARGDWAILMPAIFAGDLGKNLANFLESSSQQSLEWPLAQEKRQLVEQFIGRHELPVRYETRRIGRPYTLVLEKTKALFEREAAARKQWAKDLAWLRQVEDSFVQ